MSEVAERVNAENDGGNSFYFSWSKPVDPFGIPRQGPYYLRKPMLGKKLRHTERSSECEKNYKQLFAEWKQLSLDDSISWIDKLKTRLGQDGNALDYLDWADEQLEPESMRPNFSDPAPENFRRMLEVAEWNGDTASRTVFERLWYTRERDDQDLVLGWFNSNLLAVRLNGHLVNPKLSNPEASRKGGYTVLPPPFVALRYEPINKGTALLDESVKSEESISVTQCVLVLGHVVECPAPVGNTSLWKMTGYILAVQLPMRQDPEMALYGRCSDFLLIRYSDIPESHHDYLSTLSADTFTVARIKADTGNTEIRWTLRELFRLAEQGFIEVSDHCLNVHLTSLSTKELEFLEVGHIPNNEPAFFATTL